MDYAEERKVRLGKTRQTGNSAAAIDCNRQPTPLMRLTVTLDARNEGTLKLGDGRQIHLAHRRPSQSSLASTSITSLW